MSRLSRIKAIQQQAKESTLKGTQRANRTSLALLLTGPILGGLPWIFSYVIYGKRVDAPKAMKYGQWAGKALFVCYMSMFFLFFFGKGSQYLDWLDTQLEPEIEEEP